MEAAKIGRVETLFLAEGERVGGTAAGGKNQPPTGGRTAPGNPDEPAVNVLSVAAGDVLTNSGRVFLLPRKQMPDGATIAATFRYPLQDPKAKGTSETTLAGQRGG